MIATQFYLDVLMDDDTTHRVTADQRDLAAWEAQPFGTPSDQLRSKFVLFQRFVAWNAMRRQSLIPKTWAWDVFNELKCVQAIYDQDTDADPGLPDRPADSSST